MAVCGLACLPVLDTGDASVFPLVISVYIYMDGSGIQGVCECFGPSIEVSACVLTVSTYSMFVFACDASLANELVCVCVRTGGAQPNVSQQLKYVRLNVGGHVP